MLERSAHTKAVLSLLERFPVVGIIGSRQVGKSTLAQFVSRGFSGPTTFFDLENPVALARLSDPILALGDLRGLVVIDEIQRRPDLFPVLRVLADRPDRPAHFLVLGSASPQLLRQSSESLAGRVAYHELSGFSLDELQQDDGAGLWLRGGFPRSYLAHSDTDSLEWRHQFVRTFLESDLPQLGFSISSAAMRRFWTMLAHQHGQILNYSELGRAFGTSDTTIRSYIDILESTFVADVLKPWSQNLRKRQVKAPKVFLSDSGILHSLLGICSSEDLQNHPKVGASFEGFAMKQVAAATGVPLRDCYFWATHTGAELDLLQVVGSRRIGFEFKRASAPTRTRSMQIALDDLELSHLFVIHAGKDNYPIAKDITALPVWNLAGHLPQPFKS